MSRREEEKIGRAPGPGLNRRRIELNPAGFQAIGNISALNPGENTIYDAWIEVNGNKVTEVEVGTEFHILVHYISENVGGLTWLSCVTAKGDGIENYEDTKVAGSTKEHTARLGNMGKNIMPDKDISLRIKLWMHDDMYQSPPYPDKSLW